MTSQEQKAMIQSAAAIGEAIKDLGQVPAGHLYASVMAYMSLAQFNAIVRALRNAGLVKEEHHLLTWVG